MKPKRITHTFSVFAISLAFIFGAILGWGITRSYSQTLSRESTPPTVGIGGGPIDEQILNSTIPAKIDNLLKDHGNMVTLHLQALYDGKDTNPTQKQLDTNSQEIADIVTGIYGRSAGDMFLPMWTEHINQYVIYTQGLKTDDENLMASAKERLAQLANEKGDSLHALNNEISANEITNLMDEHIDLTLKTIEDYAYKDQAAVINDIKASNDQATKFAAYLSTYFTPKSSPQSEAL